MSGQAFTTSTNNGVNPSGRGKPTGNQVAEFIFNSSTFMVSPHPEHGSAVKVTMQGQSMAIEVATVVFTSVNEISEITWETPFSGRPPEWQEALVRLVIDYSFPVLSWGAKR